MRGEKLGGSRELVVMCCENICFTACLSFHPHSTPQIGCRTARLKHQVCDILASFAGLYSVNLLASAPLKLCPNGCHCAEVLRGAQARCRNGVNCIA